jgi:hypothetical protein
MEKSVIKRTDAGDFILATDMVTGETWKEERQKPIVVKTQQAVNFTKAVVKHVATGRKKVSLEVIQERFEMCQNCPDGLFVQLEGKTIPKQLREGGTVGTCSDRRCRCYIHGTEKFPNKLAWGSTSCPRGHWGRVK